MRGARPILEARMHGIRLRLEASFVRNAAQLAEELAQERRDQLDGLVDELDERGAQVKEAETKLGEIEQRLTDLGVEGEGGERLQELLEQVGEREKHVALLREALDAESARVHAAEDRLEERESILARLLAQEEELQELAERSEELEQREQSLLPRELELQGRQAELADREAVVGTAEELTRRRRELEELAPALEQREAAVERIEAFADMERIRVERERERILRLEGELGARIEDLTSRERAVEEREVHLLADSELREDQFERREEAAAGREERLQRRELDLASYVSELQGALTRE